MDAETRHALKQNELAAMLSRLRSLDRNVIYAIIAVIVLLLLWGGWEIYQWQARRSADRAWQELAALSPYRADTGGQLVGELKTIASDQGIGPRGQVASLRAASAMMQSAAGLPADAAQSLARDAREQVKGLIGNDAVPASIAAPALLLEASACETLLDIEGARKAYERLTSERFNGSPLQVVAMSRLDHMDLVTADVEFTPGAPPEPPTAAELMGVEPPATGTGAGEAPSTEEPAEETAEDAAESAAAPDEGAADPNAP